MSTDFAQLLNELSHENTLLDQEPAVIIDGQTRKCTVPTEFNKQIANVGDHNSNIITFNCNKIIDGHDVLNCAYAAIKWENIYAETSGTYVIPEGDRQPLEGSDTLMKFHWIVEGNATTQDGPIHFNVCFYDIDFESGRVIYKWNSNPYTEFTIGKSVYNTDVDDLDNKLQNGYLYQGEYQINTNS